MNTTLTLLKLE